jgi:hypothetical protein
VLVIAYKLKRRRLFLQRQLALKAWMSCATSLDEPTFYLGMMQSSKVDVLCFL